MLANVARLQQDMNQATGIVARGAASMSRSVEQFKSVLASVGGIISAGMFAALIKGSIDALDKLDGLSKATDIAVEKLAGLGFAARQSGGDLDSIAAAVSKLSQNIGKEPEKFRALGISAKEPLEAFKQLADLFKLLQDPTQRAALMAAALGKSWQGAAPLMAEGSKKIGEMVEKGEKLSGATAELARQANELNGKLVELGGAGGMVTRIIGPLLPMFNALADELIKTRDSTDKYTNSINPLLEIMKVLLVVASDVKFVFETLGMEIAKFAEKASRLDPKMLVSPVTAMVEFSRVFQNSGGKELDEMFAADAKRRREALDKWQKDIMALGAKSGTPAAPTPGGKTAEQIRKEAEAAARAAAFLTDANKKAGDAYDSITQRIREQTAALNAEFEGREKLTSAEQMALKIRQQIADKTLVLTATQKKDLEQNLAALKVADERLKQRKEWIELSKIMLDQMEKEITERERLEAIQREAIQSNAQAIKDVEFETELLKLEAQGIRGVLLPKEDELRLNAQINAQREIAIGLRKIDLDLARQIAAVGDQESEAARRKVADLEAVAEAQRNALPDAIRNREAQRLTNELARNSTQEFLTMWQTVEQTGRQVFTSVFSSGKNAFEGIGKAIKASIIDMLYQLTLKKWIIQIGAQMSDQFGGGAGSAGGLFGGGGFNPISSLQNLFGLGAGTAGAAGAAGAGAYGAAAGAAGAGFLGAGAGAGVAGAAGVGAAGAAGAASAAVGAGAAAGVAAVPVVGWVAAAAILAMSLMGDEGGPKGSRAWLEGSKAGGFGIGVSDVLGGENMAAILALNAALNDAKQYDPDTLARLVGTGVGSDQPADTAALLGELSKALGEAATKAAELTREAEELAEAEKRIAEQKQALEIRLMQASGDEVGALAAQRRIEMEATDETLRAILGQIHAQEDLAKAAAAAAEAIEREHEAIRAEHEQRMSIEDQRRQFGMDLLSLTDPDKAAIAMRELQIAAAFPENRDILRDIFAAQDLAKAQERGADAAKELADAERDLFNDRASAVSSAAGVLRTAFERESSELQQAADRWKSASQGLRAYADTLGMGGVRGLTYSAALRDFSAMALAARSGDMEAAAGLSGAGDVFLETSLRRAGTALEYARDVARVRSTVLDTATFAEDQESVALQQLDALTMQVDTLIDIDGTLVNVNDAMTMLNGKVDELKLSLTDQARDTKTTKELVQAVTIGQISLYTRTEP